MNQMPEAGVSHRPVSPARLPPLDGLRGIAILLVMLYHYEARYYPWRSGLGEPLWAVMREGWLGVDLFFVLSGFLITGILYDSKPDPGYFRNFYARRTLRIFPLYYAYLIAVFLIGPALPHIAVWQTGTAFEVQVWFWSYLSNLLIGVRGWAASPNLVAHFWSLAVEEQFYLVWPAVVLFSGRRTLVWICLACVAGALALRTGLRLGHVPWVANYVLTPARVDSLAMGALVALAVRGAGGLARVARFARPFAIVMAIVFFALFHWRGLVDAEDEVIGTAGLTVCALLFAGCIAVAVTERPGSLVYRALTIRALTMVGKFSYAMYVLHVAARRAMDELGFSLAALDAIIGWSPAAHAVHILANVLVTFGLAALSWHILEAPFLQLKNRFRSVQRQ